VFKIFAKIGAGAGAGLKLFGAAVESESRIQAPIIFALDKTL